ncbi:rhamnogalacturonan acetylesterase [Streptomyces sp. PRKS01-29]|nr:rhamnogalacturonan acetylesterase [Streptomyces sabulosicollis]MBI0296868.1 rhamnogalacturonan acetylesterase [Streptomyces sabulosicollis]
MRRAGTALLAATACLAALPGAPAWAGTPGTTGGPAVATATAAPRCTGTAPILCHADVPPGTYDVTAVLGGARSGSTSVTAESRRAMLAATPTAAGQRLIRSFTVNVREPEGEPTGPSGSPGLDLAFGGAAPRLAGLRVTRVLKITKVPKVTKVPEVTRVPEVTQVAEAAQAAEAAPSRHHQLFLAGDSTVCDQLTAPYTGWGQQLPQFFRRGLSVANYADSGESSGSFLADPRLFATMRPLIRAGDTVLIQFAHNDKQTTAADYRAHLGALLDGIRARGGKPVLVTPIVRRWFNDDGTLDNATALHINGLGVNLPAETRSLAAERGVPLIDLTTLTKRRVEELGPEESKRLYLYDEARDNTHTSAHGATEFARLVLGELRAQHLVPAGVLR